MADLTITAANVAHAGPGVGVRSVQVGEAVTQGEAGYLHENGKYMLADADGTTATADAKCIFLTPASSDGWCSAAFTGPVNLGATLTVGEQYYVSDTPGKIKPASDLAAGDFVTLLGIATASNKLNLDINASGAEVPA